MEFVKFTQQKRDPVTGDSLFEMTYDHTGTDRIQKPIMEDVLCTILHWGRLCQNPGTQHQYYEDVVWLRRMDDGTIEYAFPSEVVFLDTMDSKTEKHGKQERDKAADSGL